MRELTPDPFYRVLKEYDRLEIDYFLIDSGSAHEGCSSHKAAVIFAMQRLCERYPWITYDAEAAEAEKLESDKLFFFPDVPKDGCGKTSTMPCLEKASGGRIPYWYAFSEPPHGTGPVIKDGVTVRQRYGKEDFEIINHAMFPFGTEELEVYEWSTGWSDYFDAGREWWGTFCCSIYDKKAGRYAVIMASSTD